MLQLCSFVMATHCSAKQLQQLLSGPLPNMGCLSLHTDLKQHTLQSHLELIRSTSGTMLTCV